MNNGLNGYVFLDETTDFEGAIEAKVVILEGRVHGVVRAKDGLHLKRNAFIEGEIYTDNFTADPGASCKSKLYINMHNEKSSEETKPEVTPTATGTQCQNRNLF